MQRCRVWEGFGRQKIHLLIVASVPIIKIHMNVGVRHVFTIMFHQVIVFRFYLFIYKLKFIKNNQSIFIYLFICRDLLD